MSDPVYPSDPVHPLNQVRRVAADGDGSPRKAILVGANLFVGSRVEAAARSLGASLSSAQDVAELERRLAEEKPDLILVDLSAHSLDVVGVVRVARRQGAGRIVAFGPHKDVESRARALAAGCDRWLPNSKLAEELPRLLAGDGA